MKKLVCGDYTEGSAGVALEQLGNSIDIFFSRGQSFLKTEMSTEAINDAVCLGSFCARALLENGCAALYGRLDIFRLIYISKFQSSTEYDSGKRAKTAFSWTGDVFTEEKPNLELWSVDNDIPKISRALFSRYTDHLFWAPAVDKMLDYLGSIDSTEGLDDLLSLEAEKFISEIKGKATRLYSELSKGVHWEFFSSTLAIDLNSVQVNTKEVFELISKLSLISHFIPTAYAVLPAEQAMLEYKNIKEVVQW